VKTADLTLVYFGRAALEDSRYSAQSRGIYNVSAILDSIVRKTLRLLAHRRFALYNINPQNCGLVSRHIESIHQFLSNVIVTGSHYILYFLYVATYAIVDCETVNI
jgi:hypothetical protein